MKTTIYIDGYNLYYGLLRGTPYKWLDVVALCKAICHDENPEFQVETVKFFTSPIKAKISTRKNQAVRSQRLYLNALKHLYPKQIVVVEGFFQLTKGLFPRYKNPLDKTDKVKVWRLEEKQTDVNIALHIYDDAVQEKTEQIILVSNDSDFVPAFKFIKQANPKIHIGTILPRLHTEEKNSRPTNTELSRLSDWSRHYVHPEELRSSQLPEMIPTKKKPIIKPNYW